MMFRQRIFLPCVTVFASISSALGGSGTSSPRCTAGRAAITSNQRCRWSNPSIGTCAPIMPAHPGEARHVGNRIFAGEILPRRQMSIHHLEQSLALAHIAVNHLGQLLPRNSG